jgi:hypothetical protein
MNTARHRYFFAFFLSVALHAFVLWWVIGVGPSLPTKASEAPKPEEKILFLEVMASPPEQATTEPPPPVMASVPERVPELPPQAAPATEAPPPATVAPSATAHAPAFMAAPPAPTSQDWALAASYSLKNSKRYRHTWGQQVRSMMGTAFEGVDQGLVRFRIEIAPDGTLARLETLWTTSIQAEALARHAVENMPPLPPTPTGQPLIFEKTISFQPHAEDDAPYYKDDCLPDQPGFSNPFVFDGHSTQRSATKPDTEQQDPQTAKAAFEECLKQLPQDSFEGESAHDQRQLKQWRSDKLGR